MLMVMAVIKEFYPAFHKDKTPEQIQVSVSLWHEMFKDDDGNQVLAAVKAFVATDTKGFPPSVGQIKQRLVQLNAPDMPDEAEAWTQVYKAIQNSGYHSKEEFDKLHPVVQRVVGRPEVLKAWGMLSVEETQTVIASNFQRAYRGRKFEIAEHLALPSDLRQILERQGDKMTLPTPTDPEEQKQKSIALLSAERTEYQKKVLGDEYENPILALEVLKHEPY